MRRSEMLASSATAIASDVQSERQRLSVEVAGRHDLALVDEHERIVGGGVQLHHDRRLDIVEQITAGAVHLRRAAKGVRVLNPVAPAMRLDDRRTLEEPQDIRGRLLLALQRTRAVHGGREARPRPLERLERQRARTIGGLRQAPYPLDAERGHRRHELCPVHEREPLLAHQADRLEPDPAKGGVPVHHLAVNHGLALADQWESEMRERREVSARAHGSASGHDGKNAAVEALDQ